ncbi:RidA family protein [Pigmentiphaga sp. H8]|uniref:RidA family protein n=1 Tax=unclassified Pigmentiphaga TaxID=2626614 RepID=UPI000F5A9F8D|nr:RidA family protein [Pigmentiphaga sp. H8]AZG09108.1 RidA family protein [Pigmentiphaga sp. H8]
MTTKPKYINPQGACPAQGLYSHATETASSGKTYYIAGQLSVAGDGGVAGKGDFSAQFAQVFQNLESVLKGLDMGFDNVVKFTTYLVHSQDIGRFMELRADLFPRIFSGPLFPPNTLLIIDRLVKEEFLIEVEAIAQKA